MDVNRKTGNIQHKTKSAKLTKQRIPLVELWEENSEAASLPLSTPITVISGAPLSNPSALI